ncbi:ATP-binding cassette domain-containing protein [Deinococcus sp. RM]|uniref:metal ABC transporter ATP-binding protein n=1 Tax=Deinococcus sp. RM TaxID=2316359 RepID=UPI001F16A4C6
MQDALDRVAMTDFAQRQIGELSGGQRKRAFLARALAQDARLLLLDEPFGGVDFGTSEAITTLLSDIAGGGRSVLVSTHDLGTLETLCDDVALIAARTVLTVGPTAQVLTAPNLTRTFGAARRCTAPPASPRTPADGRPDSPARPVRVRLHAARPALPSARAPCARSCRASSPSGAGR